MFLEALAVELHALEVLLEGFTGTENRVHFVGNILDRIGFLLLDKVEFRLFGRYLTPYGVECLLGCLNFP